MIATTVPADENAHLDGDQPADKPQQEHAMEPAELAAVEAALEKLLTPLAKRKRYALAAGHETERLFPQTAARIERKTCDTLECSLIDIAEIQKLRLQLQESREAYQAIGICAGKSADVSGLAQECLKHGNLSWKMHRQSVHDMAAVARPLETAEREFHSFIVACRIPNARRNEILSRIWVIPFDSRQVVAHDQFGKVGCMPPRKDEAVRIDTPRAFIANGAFRSAAEFKRGGDVAKEAGGYMTASAAPDIDVMDLRGAEIEGVWLHQNWFIARKADAIYEDPGDHIWISAAMKAAGDRLHVAQVSTTHHSGSSTVGCRPGFRFSSEYAHLVNNCPVLFDDFTHKYSEIERDVCRGVTETDPDTKRNVVSLYGQNLFETTQATSAVPVIENRNDLTIDLDIHGKRLLVSSRSRAAEIQKLQCYLIGKYVPKAFDSLRLSEDRVSDRGKQAAAEGVVLLTADIVVDGEPDKVAVDINVKNKQLTEEPTSPAKV